MFELDATAQVMAFFFVVTLVIAILVRWQVRKDHNHKS